MFSCRLEQWKVEPFGRTFKLCTSKLLSSREGFLIVHYQHAKL